MCCQPANHPVVRQLHGDIAAGDGLMQIADGGGFLDRVNTFQDSRGFWGD